ncbi:hypothetical protein [Arthrobacter silvisoli]|uniref:hypothetical protein n=1 Tax=Arthrobacter silvisoli TaxID=2291022 RepID=UPI000E21B0A4|nr:hypothetical protein [Arthrobacter silvisoli]
MRKLWAAAALCTTALLGSGCQPESAPCPAIAQAPVVGLTIAKDYVPVVQGVHLRACQDGTCKEADLKLMPGSRSIPQACSTGPDGSCSATMSPDGTMYGLLDMGVLTASPISAKVTGTASTGRPLPVRTLDFTPKSLKPFGEKCGTVITANLVLDATGLTQAP